MGKAYNIHLFFGKDVPHLHLQGRGGFGKLPWCFDRGSRQVVFPPMFNKQHYDVVLLEFSVFFGLSRTHLPTKKRLDTCLIGMHSYCPLCQYLSLGNPVMQQYNTIQYNTMQYYRCGTRTSSFQTISTISPQNIGGRCNQLDLRMFFLPCSATRATRKR